MLLVRDRFGDFTSKQICDTSSQTEVLLAPSADSRAEVDRLVDTALSDGGRAAGDPQDHGVMYGRSFQDPDGHTWEVFWMDPATLGFSPLRFPEHKPAQRRAPSVGPPS